MVTSPLPLAGGVGVGASAASLEREKGNSLTGIEPVWPLNPPLGSPPASGRGKKSGDDAQAARAVARHAALDAEFFLEARQLALAGLAIGMGVARVAFR